MELSVRGRAISIVPVCAGSDWDAAISTDNDGTSPANWDATRTKHTDDNGHIQPIFDDFEH